MDWHIIVRDLLATHALLILGGLIMLLLLSNMLRQQRNPAASAAWLLFIITVPYAGVPLYLVFGTRKLKTLAAEKQWLFADLPEETATTTSGLSRLLLELKVPPPAAASEVRFHHSAEEARAALLESLHSAQHSIDFCTFILAHDRTGKEIIHCLADRAAAGVKVRVLLDSVGSFYLFKRHLRKLLKAGGEFAWFMPVMHIPLRGRANLRNHRKLIIVDGNKVWTGGRNIADEYLQPESETRWVDLSFDLEGPIAADYLTLFNADWAFATHQPPAPSKTHGEPPQPTPEHFSQLLPSGPDMRDDALHDAVARLFMEAQERIIVVTPYFIPSEILQSQLCVAARSGIKVEILLPKQSNHRLADYARHRFLRQLHRSGAIIQCLPDTMLHAKALVIDDQYALAGSANFDLRSLYLNFELMTLFYSRKDILGLTRWIEALQDNAIDWRPKEPGQIRETLEGLVLIGAYQL